MPQIDPKFTFWFGVWTNVLMLVAGYGVEHAPPIVAQYAPTVQWLAALSAQVNSVVLTALVGVSSSKVGPLINVPIGLVKPIVIVALGLAFLFALPRDASAQVKFKTPGQIQQDIDNALKKTNAGLQKQVASVTAKVDPAQALSCDFTLLINLTPQNLIPTVKACLSDINSTLVSDTQRALTSAKAYSSSGDNDAVNCLTPALAIFQAGVQVPAVPAQDAVPATATTPAIPAVAAVPAQDPGPILLYQKYREFTLAGALTSCQAWFNGPINATAAAGIAGAGTAIAGAALLAPK